MTSFVLKSRLTSNPHNTKPRGGGHSEQQIRRVAPPFRELQSRNRKSAGVEESVQWCLETDNGGAEQMTRRCQISAISSSTPSILSLDLPN
ncbi:hypothetical protein TNCV_2558601 [Trichonephila clavipes]|nr:hypothetical protein TNCV_2558601 [Trichonephila clavipes]